MADIATLGYAVDTSGLEAGEQALDKFGAKNAQVDRQVQSMAKRAGVSYAEMAGRVQNADRNLAGFNQTGARSNVVLLDTERRARQAAAAKKQLAADFAAAGRAAALFGGQAGLMFAQVATLARGVGRLGGGLTALVVVLGAVAIGATKALGALAQLERQQKQLAASSRLSSGGGATEGQIQGLSRSTATPAADLRAAAAEIARFQGIMSAARVDILRLANDMAATGMGSIAQNAKLLATALQDPVRGLEALREAGFRVTPVFADMVERLHRTGQIGRSTAEVLKLVNDQIGGAATKKTEGISGALDQVARSFTGAMERIGSWIERLTGVSRILAGIANLMDRILPGEGVPVGPNESQSGRVVIPLKSTPADRARQQALQRAEEQRLHQERLAREAAERQRAIRDAALERARSAPMDIRAQADAVRMEAETFNMATGAAAAYAAEQSVLNDAKRAGITLGPKLVEQIHQEAQALGEAVAAAEKLRDAREAAQGFGNVLMDAFDAIRSKGGGVAEALRRITDGLINMALQATLMGQGPLAGLFGTKTGGGLLTTVFTSLLSGGATGSTDAWAGLRHTGGLVGAGGAGRRIPMPAVARLPRLHDGLYPGERLTIMQDGETVVSRADSQRNSGGGKVDVIINNNGEPLQVQSKRERRRADGGKSIELTVKSTMERLAGNGGMKDTMTNFGVKQRTVRR